MNRLEAYKWSSHKGYLSDEKKWRWLHKGFILSMLTRAKAKQRRGYRQFISKEASEEIRLIYSEKNLPSVLGSEQFIDWVKDRFFHQKSHEEATKSRALAPDREKIKQVVCKAYNVDEEDLLSSKRGTFNEARNVAIYLTRQLRGDKLGELCKEFQMKRCSSASSVIERLKVKVSKDKKLKKRLEKLRLMLVKSQA